MAQLADRIDEYRRRKQQQINLDRSALSPRMAELYGLAMTYRMRCFWQSLPPATEEGLQRIGQCLRENGDLRAWYLANEIDEELTNAVRQSSI